jgi:hypothetical protein
MNEKQAVPAGQFRIPGTSDTAIIVNLILATRKPRTA